MSSRHTDIVTRPVRRVLEDEIERLIALLDEIDGDADLEPDADDEDTHDREEVCEDEGAQCDDEGCPEYACGPDSEDEAIFPPKGAPTSRPVDPSLLPDRYFMRGDGDCLHPVIRDGARLDVSRTDTAAPGDFVVVWIHRAFRRPGEHQAYIKRLIHDGRDGSMTLPDGRPAVFCEMFNPPQRIAYPAVAVIAVHKVLGVNETSPSYRWISQPTLPSRLERPAKV